jgi:hypothetical protein
MIAMFKSCPLREYVICHSRSAQRTGMGSAVLTKDRIEARIGINVTTAINAERPILAKQREQMPLDMKSDVNLTKTS